MEKKDVSSVASTGISPLAENLFLSPPNSRENFLSVGKLTRCTSTPSYSSLFNVNDDPLFTANIQLDKDTRTITSDQNQDSILTSCDVSHNESDSSSVSNKEVSKRTLDRLGAECLVSLAKRKEHFYNARTAKNTQIQNKRKDVSIQELGESLSNEADSGFETMCSTTADSIISELEPKLETRISEKSSPLRRSPRNTSHRGNQEKSPISLPSQQLSTSLGAIPKATNHILTRSKSLRLSGDSYLTKSPQSLKASGQYSPTLNDLRKASTSLISKFDSSLLADKRKDSVSFEIDTNYSLDSSSDILDRVQEVESKRQTLLPTTDNPSSHYLHRDLPCSGFGKRHHLINVKDKKERIQHSVGRIVYSPGVFHGRDRLDVVRRLNDMSASHILDKIWARLSAEDLGRALQVSKTWNQSIIENKDAIVRLTEAKNRLLENPPPSKSSILRKLNAVAASGGGNLPLTRSSQRLLLLKTSPRKVLSSVSNILLDPNSHQAHQIVRRNGASSGHSLAISRSSNAVLQSSKSGHTNSSNDVRQISSSCKREMVKSQQTVDASPSKLRHNLFTQEASRLEPGEQLQSCPRCTSPSRVKPTEGWAQCSRISCQFLFCIRCLCDQHPKEMKCKSRSKLSSSRKPSKTELIFPDIAKSELQAASFSSSVNELSPQNGTSKILTSTRTSKATVASKKSRTRLKRL